MANLLVRPAGDDSNANRIVMLDLDDWQKLVKIRDRLYADLPLHGDARRDLAKKMHYIMDCGVHADVENDDGD